MRTFIVLCLVAVSCADKLGYNYHPVGHSHSGLSFAPGFTSNSIPTYVDSHNSGDYVDNLNGVPSYVGPHGDFGGASYSESSFAPQAELEKEFYTFEANDEDFKDPAAANQYANSVKQGLRVIFIKGPENNGLENAALALAKHVSEQKTDIYVLNKQADLAGLSDKLNAVNKNNNNKPEVHFVKYRTPEDAENAQKAIQGQYDSLGGPSQSYNGGVAPVLNFASKAPVASHGSYGGSAPAYHGSYGGSFAPSASYIPPSAGFTSSVPSSSYLPASIFRRFRL